MAKATPVPQSQLQTAVRQPPPGWEDSFLAAIKAPKTEQNVEFLDIWYMAEHGGTGSNPNGYSGGDYGGLNNPFDTTLSSSELNSPVKYPSQKMAYGPASVAGVQEFPTWTEGAAANAQVLEQTNMQPLLAALQSGNASVEQLESAEGQTPWGQESSWPSYAKVPTSGAPAGLIPGIKTSYNVNNPSATPGATPTPTPSGGAKPWGGAFGSQIDEGVFFLFGVALIIVGLVITFRGSGEANPAEAPAAAAPKKRGDLEVAAEAA